MSILNMRTSKSFRHTMAADMGVAVDQYVITPSSPFFVFKKTHDSHPSLGHLILLVFEAVLEVVCVSLPGYIIARLGYFDVEKQKFLANLNVMLFTPCLIFTKLASQLNADKLIELGVIPIIFIIQTLVSYLVSVFISKCFGFNKRASNFVTAMGVFGNSNSLPISLVISLSQTLKGLHWDKIKGDNDDEVAARGILYLLIFQQLGQLVRWSWGYHVLLAPNNKYEDYSNDLLEDGRYRGEDHHQGEAEALIQGIHCTQVMGDEQVAHGQPQSRHHRRSSMSDTSDVYEPAGQTPVVGSWRGTPNDSDDEMDASSKRNNAITSQNPPLSTVDRNDGACYGGFPEDDADGILSFPRIRNSDEPEIPTGLKGLRVRTDIFFQGVRGRLSHKMLHVSHRVYLALPFPLQRVLTETRGASAKVYSFLQEFMNPPLWAMLIAVMVASVPDLQRLFFSEGSFVKNSVTAAVTSSGGVAVPLILVVLGANLARNTQKREDDSDPEEMQIRTRLLIASLISRMLLPTLIMVPILALFAKYVPVSILDDPIFIVVCFLVVGAPSALQLAQICQINGVFENVMIRVLFHSYVIWILPSTLALVMCALEVVKWAQ